MRVSLALVLLIVPTQTVHAQDTHDDVACRWVAAELRRIDAEVRFGELHPDRREAESRADAFEPGARRNPARVQTCVRDRLATLRTLRARESTRLGPRHPTMQILNRQIRWLERQRR